ncbi:hypothetical protein BHECKSOX2_1297 [Bathymodiolus heckerae thiotrophic gill symbiont]|nr:hypothetical protein [uncultured Gammaproteobacteria bacterium]SMN14025.1 hypothetical protein BHECKSOX2_1297 [Bathymodiolus heckerae thiotrophic gill symbiont]
MPVRQFHLKIDEKKRLLNDSIKKNQVNACVCCHPSLGNCGKLYQKFNHRVLVNYNIFILMETFA